MTEWTKETQWHDIAQAAVLLGIVPDLSKTSTLKINKILQERVDAGLVRKRKEGEAQSAHAFYSARIESHAA